MDNFLAMERKGRDLFKSLLEDGNITKYKESTGRYNPVVFYLHKIVDSAFESISKPITNGLTIYLFSS